MKNNIFRSLVKLKLLCREMPILAKKMTKREIGDHYFSIIGILSIVSLIISANYFFSLGGYGKIKSITNVPLGLIAKILAFPLLVVWLIYYRVKITEGKFREIRLVLDNPIKNLKLKGILMVFLIFAMFFLNIYLAILSTF